MNRLRKFNKRENRVTIIVGIICKGGILLASDSQTTIGGQSKRCDTEKIRVVEFKSGEGILVAQAGCFETSSRTIDILEKLAASQQLTDEESVISLVRQAILKSRNEVREQHFNCPSEEMDAIIEKLGLDADFMVGHYVLHQKPFWYQPFLHTFNFRQGTCRTSKTFYESLGCGASVANLLISEYCESRMAPSLALANAVLIIDKVIKHDAFCGHPIRCALIYAFTGMPTAPNIQVKSIQEIEDVVQKIREIDAATKAERVGKLQSGLGHLVNTFELYPPNDIKLSDEIGPVPPIV
jgi:20S proteasome alpha/beta subunit